MNKTSCTKLILKKIIMKILHIVKIRINFSPTEKSSIKIDQS